MVVAAGEPDVGLALDSEWRMPGGATPGTRIGHVDAHEVNAVSARLARFVRAHRLPQKLFLLHQFTAGMVDNVSKIAPHRELAATNVLKLHPPPEYISYQ